MLAKMIKPRKLKSFEIKEGTSMWEAVNDHHLSYIQDSVYYNGWCYAVYDVDGNEYISKVKVDGIGRKGGVKNPRHNTTVQEASKLLDVPEHMFEDTRWIGGDHTIPQ